MLRRESKVLHVLKALLVSYVLTGLMLLILTLLLYKLDMDEQKVTVGIIVIYILSTFAGGFLIGKMEGTRKFIWGMALGIIYFGLLLLISIGVNHSLQSNGTNIVTTLLLCTGGGMFGGMLS